MNHPQAETIELTSVPAQVRDLSLESNHDDEQATTPGVSQIWLDHANGAQGIPEGAASDERPSRHYQVALLIAGFLMIFQVIGLNQVYGVFQVRSLFQHDITVSIY